VQDLAPAIHRQRLVIEGIPNRSISEVDIVEYLKILAKVLDMSPLMEPVAHLSPKFGWAGWTHWETSGAHFYAWDTPLLFFSVDIYTCKAFHNVEAVNFTRDFFGAETIVHHGF
jgi:hypothetical protein